MKIVVVDWLDACSSSGYFNKEHPEEHSPIRCRTVGFLKVKNRKMVIVVSEAFDDGDSRHTHTIPRKMVKSIKVLRGE